MVRAAEDEVVFSEDGNEGPKVRVLRGTIIGEDHDFVTLVRDDGTWSIRKSLVQKIRRAHTARTGMAP